MGRSARAAPAYEVLYNSRICKTVEFTLISVPSFHSTVLERLLHRLLPMWILKFLVFADSSTLQQVRVRLAKCSAPRQSSLASNCFVQLAASRARRGSRLL